jgi:hypothetical protein
VLFSFVCSSLTYFLFLFLKKIFTAIKAGESIICDSSHERKKEIEKSINTGLQINSSSKIVKAEENEAETFTENSKSISPSIASTLNAPKQPVTSKVVIRIHPKPNEPLCGKEKEKSFRAQNQSKLKITSLENSDNVNSCKADASFSIADRNSFLRSSLEGKETEDDKQVKKKSKK